MVRRNERAQGLTNRPQDEMQDVLAFAISAIALCVSILTAWLTLLRRGRLKMTRPTVIFFGPDGGDGPPKVFLRTLLYCTSKRGRVIENMFVRVRRGETKQNFNIWVYDNGSLVRGSGLFVGDQGIAANHHFLLPADGTSFSFLAGTYEVDVFVSCVGDHGPRLLHTARLTLSIDSARKLDDKTSGAYFDWGPDSLDYVVHIREAPAPSKILQTMVNRERHSI